MAQLKSEKKEPRKILADLHMGNKNIFFSFSVCTYKTKEKNLGGEMMLAFSSPLIDI